MNRKDIEQYKIELFMLRRSNHPFVLKFIETFEVGVNLAIVTEYITGGDFETLI